MPITWQQLDAFWACGHNLYNYDLLDFKVIIRMGERFGVTLNMATDELLV